jgi:integrase
VLPNPIVDTELHMWPLAERGESVRSPELAEVQAILAAAIAYDERFGAFVRLVAATGVRRGEACTLGWTDIEWGSGTVVVDESVVAAAGEAEVKAPKTKASIRRLAVETGTVEVLRTLRVSQERLAAMCEVEIADDGLVISYEPSSVEPHHPDTMRHQFTKVRNKAKTAKDIHLHSLRHIQATVLDRVIPERQKQARLGWATVHMARRYTDVIAAEDLRAAEHVGRLLGGTEEDGADGVPQFGQQPEAEAS